MYVLFTIATVTEIGCWNRPYIEKWAKFAAPENRRYEG